VPPLRAESLGKAMRAPLFWSLALSRCGFEIFWVGWNFHFVEAASALTAGRISLAHLARAYYIPLTVAFNGADIIVGVTLTDRLTSLGRIRTLAILNACSALVMGSLPLVRTEGALTIFALSFGTFAGCREALTRVSLSSLFGTRALGHIEGLHQGIMVCSTGISPLLWAASLTAGGPGLMVPASCLVLLVGATATLLLSACIVPLALPPGDGVGEAKEEEVVAGLMTAQPPQTAPSAEDCEVSRVFTSRLNK